MSLKVLFAFFLIVLSLPHPALALNDYFHQCENMLLTKQRPRAPIKISLFENGKPVKNYNDLVKDIRAGDDLKFDDGSVFHVEERFGAGMTTLLLDIGNDELLRIPLYVTTHILDQNPLPFIADFQAIQPELVANGVPVVEMVIDKNIPDQAVVVKKENLQFSLKDYLDGQKGDGRRLKLSKKEKEQLEDKLVEFARKTWMYERIGDFRTTELGYNGEQWIVFDAADDLYPHVLIQDLKSGKNVFSPFMKWKGYETSEMEKDPQLPSKLYEKVKEAIKDERKKQRKNPKLFRQIQERGVYSRNRD